MTKTYFEQHIDCIKNIRIDYLNKLIDIIKKTVKNKKNIITFGNGGSASEAQHFTSELVGKYKSYRPSIKSICLNNDSSSLTAIANDFGYEFVFSRMLESIAEEDDLIICFSTSGKSKNILNAIKSGYNLKTKIILFTGDSFDESLDGPADGVLHIFTCNSDISSIIQETHQVILHYICEHLEKVD
jgi:D-sedoheptulose 7-phosphate isomerase